MARRLAGVRFQRAGKVHYCDTGDLELQVNDQVVVDTEHGLELGWVVIAPQQIIHAEETEPPRPILRVATLEDLSRQETLRGKEREALALAKDKAKGLGMEMKLIDARYTLDSRRVTLSFTAEKHVEFRPLLQALGEGLRARITLHQIGARDEAKIIGGLGKCGRVVCCTDWMDVFSPVHIRMAKEQALPISAEHLSGQCGRLLCCLRFEYAQYVEMNKALPRIGEWVETPKGKARVIVGHVLRQTVSVVVGDEETVELPLAEVVRTTAERN